MYYYSNQFKQNPGKSIGKPGKINENINKQGKNMKIKQKQGKMKKIVVKNLKPIEKQEKIKEKQGKNMKIKQKQGENEEKYSEKCEIY